MPITSVNSDLQALTLTVVGDYAVPVERLWAAWADPRQIERFWGPPTWPATFTRHDLVEAGRSEYFMTGPEGEKAGGYWEYTSVDAPRSFEIRDGFVGEDGVDNDEMPVTLMRADFEATPEGSRFTLVSTFPSQEAMEQLVAMGMVEGLSSALAQLDGVLAELREYASGRGTELHIVDDTHVRITRLISGTVEQVWRAHHEPELLQRWLLGPEGWTMPVCEVATTVGEKYRYEWEAVDGSARFGFEGELLEVEPPHRAVSTENMIGVPGPGTVNELTLVAAEGGTLLTLVITYPSLELRDMILATGMVDGMETSYARLEREVLTSA